MPSRDDAPSAEIKPTTPQEAVSLQHYTRIASLLLGAEVRTQMHNSINTDLSLGLPAASLRAVRTDDRPFEDLPGRNPLSAFANLASLIVGQSRPPLAMSYQWGTPDIPARYSELGLKNEGMTPEQFDRERSRIESMQWDIARLVRSQIGPQGMLDPYVVSGNNASQAMRQQFAEQLTFIITSAQMGAARDQLQSPSTGTFSLQHWAAQNEPNMGLLDQRLSAATQYVREAMADLPAGTPQNPIVKPAHRPSGGTTLPSAAGPP